MSRVELRAEGVQAVIVPNLGGRMLSLRFDGREVLWHDPELLDDHFQPRHPIVRPPLGAGFAAWQNWGGDKTWPAPQALPGDAVSGEGWPGPPDGVLDSGVYQVLASSRDTVRLSSGTEPRTGLRIERELRTEPGAIIVRSSVINDSGAAARWAAWEVAQFPFGTDDLESDRARIAVRVSGEASPVVLFAPVGSIGWSRDGDTVSARFGVSVGKLGFPGATGMAELVHSDGCGVRMSFAVTEEAEYADDSPVQLWMQAPMDRPLAGLEGMSARARYVELEALSPVRLLDPGDRISLEVRWEPVDPAVPDTTAEVPR